MAQKYNWTGYTAGERNKDTQSTINKDEVAYKTHDGQVTNYVTPN